MQATDLKSSLDQLLLTSDKLKHVAHDPVEFVRKFQGKPGDVEVVGLLSSALAFGKVDSIRKKIKEALSVLGESPAATIEAVGREDLRRKLKGFQHRWTTGDDLADLLTAAAKLRQEHGSMGDLVAHHFNKTQNFRAALYELSSSLRKIARPKLNQTFANLIPDVMAGSACKRLMLYARWMIRKEDGVDLGVWSLPARVLVIPVDTHIARISHYIGLTQREDASWKTAEEITAALRALDPEDPVKYDFALCHLGISGSCPKKRHPIKCEGCPIRGICQL
jgi:uncharacterized protein (TIGR02757 family)